jgi:hypothetical protein
MSAPIHSVLILGYVGLLRIILLIASVVFFAFVALPIGQYPLRYGILILLVLNFIYVLLSNKPSNWRTPNWRIFRLDAKESELRRRARQDK